MKHTLVALVENKPGVLNRVASLFRRRNFNIDSLTVGRTEDDAVSRMTIVLDSTETEAWRVEENLYKLVNVIQVADLTHQAAVSRDLALVKVAVDTQTRQEVMQLCEIFRAKIIDASIDTVIVEITGAEDKISGLVDVLKPFGIVEMVRTGVVSMSRREHVANGYKPSSSNGSN
jgi:acetolactate synthase-1/3 small subunit